MTYMHMQYENDSQVPVPIITAVTDQQPILENKWYVEPSGPGGLRFTYSSYYYSPVSAKIYVLAWTAIDRQSSPGVTTRPSCPRR